MRVDWLILFLTMCHIFGRSIVKETSPDMLFNFDFQDLTRLSSSYIMDVTLSMHTGE
jgi:hypothetical protein